MSEHVSSRINVDDGIQTYEQENPTYDNKQVEQHVFTNYIKFCKN